MPPRYFTFAHLYVILVQRKVRVRDVLARQDAHIENRRQEAVPRVQPLRQGAQEHARVRHAPVQPRRGGDGVCGAILVRSRYRA